ncbi:unnamed protein product [Acanthoscelides obtectus]|uniref:Uncharacterized protein n=1 Tax=Acanthoscelides obtectus TaxID=200917 RepID=A0A9P0LZE7_ACAOB|nr:unnamed protein product [Acanthoscelides obtectus]CAK1670171.1 hypothetical protein AOBTE_LOCUS27447 [Acanthoscelides obtectus]
MACRERKWLPVVLLAVALASKVESAPSKGSKGPKTTSAGTVFDQKQTGDYNIQLHLKDFQIIALLADDSAGFGDYDYAYDYSDYTPSSSSQKPSTDAPLLPPKPPSSSQSPTFVSTSSPSIISSTHQPPLKPIHTDTPSSSKPINSIESSSEAPIQIQTNEAQSSKPSILTGTSSDPLQSSENQNQLVTEQGVPSKNEESSLNEIQNKPATQRTSDELSFGPGKIKVQIIETPVADQAISIIPGEEEQPSSVDSDSTNESVPQGDMVHIRKCAQGYTRDKKGRCRRLRKPIQPHLTFGLGRLASNLASRFRHPSYDGSSSESTED